MKFIVILIIGLVGSVSHGQDSKTYEITPQGVEFRDNGKFFHRILIPLATPIKNKKSILLICKNKKIYVATLSKKTEIGVGFVSGTLIFDRSHTTARPMLENENCFDFVDTLINAEVDSLKIVFDLNQDSVYLEK